MGNASVASEVGAAVLLAARAEAGLSQRELAARAGTSGATVAAYERGTKEPRLSTLHRLLVAAGMKLDLSYAPVSKERLAGLTREDQRSLALHRAIVTKLAADPETVLTKARRNLSVMRRANQDGGAEPWFAEWERLLRGPLSAVIEVLVSTNQRARDLRQVTPFAGVLSDEERRAIYQAERAA
ncbi:MAG: helix-turn-helix domain-containing protein [Actinomycetota bacterium]